MSVDLLNTQHHYFGASNRGWGRFLALAEMYGWQPYGTLEPAWWNEDEYGLWDVNDFYTNNGQIVMSADAAGIAQALEKALHDIPDIDLFPAPLKVERSSILSTYLTLTVQLIQVDLADQPDPAILGFTAETKSVVRELMEFCLEGPFQIK